MIVLGSTCQPASARPGHPAGSLDQEGTKERQAGRARTPLRRRRLQSIFSNFALTHSSFFYSLIKITVKLLPFFFLKKVTLKRLHEYGYSEMFQLCLASSHQNVLATAKHLIFQSTSIKIRFDKNRQNQHKHIISRVVTTVGIRHFVNPELYRHLHFTPHVILIIIRFSTQSDYRKNWLEKN